MGKKQFTTNQLINLLNRFYNETGKVPTNRNIKEKKYMPNNHVFYDYFGSFENALKEAGLRHLRKDNYSFERRNYNKSELLEKLSIFINKNNKIPTNKEIDKCDYMPSSSTYRRIFGNIKNAIKILGYDPKDLKNKQEENIKSDMLEKVIELSLVLGKIPTSRDIDEYSKKGFMNSASTYTSHFGSMKNLFENIGFDKIVLFNNKHKRRTVKLGRFKNKEDLINDVKKLYKDLGYIPSVLDLNNAYHTASYNTYCKYFDSWSNVLKKANLPISEVKIKVTKNGTKCFSRYEYIFACILEKLNINFEKEVRYKDVIKNYNGNKRFDFVIDINNKLYFIEIFGVEHNEIYEQGKKEKIKLCKENNIPLITFYPEDFWGNKNKDIINNLFSQINNNKSA